MVSKVTSLGKSWNRGRRRSGLTEAFWRHETVRGSVGAGSITITPWAVNPAMRSLVLENHGQTRNLYLKEHSERWPVNERAARLLVITFCLWGPATLPNLVDAGVNWVAVRSNSVRHLRSCRGFRPAALTSDDIFEPAKPAQNFGRELRLGAQALTLDLGHGAAFVLGHCWCPCADA